MMEQMKPCPFCGSPASTECNPGFGPSGAPWAVGCDEDGCAEFAWFASEAEAIAAWNRRAPTGVDTAMPERRGGE